MKTLDLDMSRLIERISTLEGVSVSTGVRLDEYTTIGVGGPCAAMMVVERAEVLSACLKILRPGGEPVVDLFVLGGGSNLLVGDSGYNGLVLRLGKGFEDIEESNGKIVVGASCPLKELAARGVKEGWGGLEYFAGLPGTAGGAVRMNAGAWGKEMWDLVRNVHLVEGAGVERTVSRSDITPGYRCSGLGEGSIVTSVELACDRGNPLDLRKRSKQFMVRRKERQPIGLPSFGSVFRNPEGFQVGKLIDSLGMKGRVEGKAMIPEEHANFIVNIGGASAADVVRLMRAMKQGVLDEYGIMLEPEVVFLGMTPADLEGVL